MSVRRDDATDKIIGCVFSQLYFTSFTTNCNFLKLKSFLLNWQTSYVKLEIRYKVDKTSVCVTLLFFNNFFLSKTAHSSSCSWFCVVFTASVSDPVRVEAPHQQTIGDKWRNERLTSAEDDTHSHSFMGLERRGWRPNDSFGIQRQLWPKKQRPCLNRDQLSISVWARRGRLPELCESCWQIKPTDPVNECTRTNAFGFDTGQCRTFRSESISWAD